MSIILLQCRKELIQFARDRLTLALAFVLPLITLLVLGNVIRFEMKNVPVVIQDQDLSPLSRALTQRLSATTLFRPVTWKGSDPVDQALDRNLAKAVIVIPPEFTRRVKARRPAFIQVLIDGIEVNNARLIRNSVIGTTEFLLQSESLSPLEQNVKVNLRIWFNPGREESLFVVPGVYALVLAAYPALLSAIAMVREKEQGTIMQVYAS
ncbi:MAG: ABC transporter permease, partial [Cyanobacteria bacterium]|nr:ABC transporter permease [Cyanobacteriota bacterium]